jgi:hypothetical protein
MRTTPNGLSQRALPIVRPLIKYKTRANRSTVFATASSLTKRPCTAASHRRSALESETWKLDPGPGRFDPQSLNAVQDDDDAIEDNFDRDEREEPAGIDWQSVEDGEGHRGRYQSVTNCRLLLKLHIERYEPIEEWRLPISRPGWFRAHGFILPCLQEAEPR